MKLLINLAISATLVSCGRVQSTKEILNPNYDHVKQSEFDSLEKRVTALEERLDNTYDRLDNLEADIDTLEVDQDQLEQEVSLTLVDIVNLENTLDELGHGVTEIIDPCGDNPGQFDEVLLKLSNGDIIAYFEQGSKRYLSILPNGNYLTTDNQACSFSVVNGEFVE